MSEILVNIEVKQGGSLVCYYIRFATSWVYRSVILRTPSRYCFVIRGSTVGI